MMQFLTDEVEDDMLTAWHSLELEQGRWFKSMPTSFGMHISRPLALKESSSQSKSNNFVLDSLMT